jgi:hypothetical protein
MNRTSLFSFDIVAALGVAVLTLASCFAIQPPAAPQPLEPPAVTPAVTPTPVTGERVDIAAAIEQARLVADDGSERKGCTPGAGQAVYTDPAGAYCFAFPDSLRVNGAGPTSLSLVGPPLTTGPDGLFVSLGIESAPAAEAGLTAAVDAALAEFAGFTAWEISRTESTLGGVPALRVEPVPGRLSSRVLFAEHEGVLYRLSFWPAEPGPAEPDLEALYAAVTESFAFLDAGDPLAQNQATAAITGVVRHGDTAVEGALVTLRTPDWRTNRAAVIMETQSGADGRYALVGVPAGDFELVPAWPPGLQSDAPPAAGQPVQVGAGRTAATADLALVAALTVIAPQPDATVSRSPSISWQAAEGAARYRVVVVGVNGADAPFAGDVTGTTLALEPPLDPGAYEVVINALTASGAPLAVGGTRFVVE